MATRKYSFVEIGILKQEQARTSLEAKQEMINSCSRCYRRYSCNEQWCKIHEAHERQLDYIEFKRREAKKIERPFEDHIQKIREYKTTSQANKKKHALSLLTKVTKKLANGSVEFELELAIDDASALISLDDYKTAIGILKNVKLKNLAQKLSEILL